MTAEKAEALGVTPIARFVDTCLIGSDPALMLTGPIGATARLLADNSMTIDDIDVVEINEAFAAVALASIDALGVPPDIVNVNGGAIALGHPIGMSGTRIVLTLAHELKRRGGGLGAAGLCGGGGQGEALVLRTVA